MLKPVVALQDFLDQTSILWNQQGEKPEPVSQASLELVTFARPESIGTAYSQALILFEAAADYSMALVKTLTEPAQTVAPWSCARSVLETSALATWLWDTRINARQRVQRSLAFRYEGLLQQLKFAQASKKGVDKQMIIERLDEIEKIALSLGFAKIVDKKNQQRIGIAQVMPSVTKIIEEMFDKETNYRLLSAMVHGHSWAVQPLSFGQMGDQQEIFVGIQGKVVEKHLDYSSVVFLCVEAVSSLSKPILMKIKLFGWDAKPMALVINQAIKQIKDC
jgi:hypothetical protein